jgi:hypothetical protein
MTVKKSSKLIVSLDQRKVQNFADKRDQVFRAQIGHLGFRLLLCHFNIQTWIANYRRYSDVGIYNVF